MTRKPGRGREAGAPGAERWSAGGGEVDVDVVAPTDPRAVVFVLGHGAGLDRNDPLLVDVAARLSKGGHGVVRFDFRYRSEGRRMPDRAPVLEQTFRDVAAKARERFGARIVLGGKSMGGRMASHLAAAGDEMAGLLLLCYPLYPAKHPEKVRKAHLPSVRVPTLFVSGTRDPLAALEDLRPVVEAMPKARLHVVAGGDHSLVVPKSSGRDRASVIDEVAEVILDWATKLRRRVRRS
ncbi:MAG TPA: alpha/beta family hydrolase [Polyangiaceae bacterium]|nr:alpha/beta family hydrolase [Polyangiaceae bacterium]